MNNNLNKTKLTVAETVSITSMLFGMFFGAGNLIFPVYMGQVAGFNVWPAVIGFLITGVGMPLLAVAALGISRSNGLTDLAGKVGGKYSVFFTCALYLTIGPFFASPRCATVPFSMAVMPLLGDANEKVCLAVFSLLFFAVVLTFSLKPGKIITWIGKFLNPVFLCCLAIFIVAALISPMGSISEVAPAASYETGAFFNGFLEGYNTMDLLAGLAFGIVVINVIKGLGVTEPGAIAANTVKAGIFSCLLMGFIYVLLTLIGVQSRGITEACANGSEAFYVIANHYFGVIGIAILAVTVTFACLKTSVGLTTSCAETFSAMFPKGPSYKVWAITFATVAFLVANLGLTSIITYAIPVLMFLYPLAITLILLALGGKFFNHDKRVYVSVTAFTLVAALFDLLKTLPEGARALLHVDGLLAAVSQYLPLFDLGMGWIVPALAGLVIGLVLRAVKK
ncbi:MAG: branched-chain amino acid transport system II carrier protein [Firmicutes bacterium]|nr:branched-chain amino acid transport system II carrier protein [Bacillota bacterium]